MGIKFNKELNKDISCILVETNIFIIANEIESIEPSPVVINKCTNERVRVSSIKEGRDYIKSFGKEENVLKAIDRAKILSMSLEEVLKDRELEYKPSINTYLGFENHYGEPCVKVKLEDGTSVIFGQEDLKYLFLKKMSFKDSEIESIAKTLSAFYKDKIDIIENKKPIKTYINGALVEYATV